jgi:hypothetical protein
MPCNSDRTPIAAAGSIATDLSRLSNSSDLAVELGKSPLPPRTIAPAQLPAIDPAEARIVAAVDGVLSDALAHDRRRAHRPTPATM